MTPEQKMVWAAVFGAAYTQQGRSLEWAVDMAGLAVGGLAKAQDELSKWCGKDSNAAQFTRTMGADLVTFGNQDKERDDSSK